jgi:hypothetical protein
VRQRGSRSVKKVVSVRALRAGRPITSPSMPLKSSTSPAFHMCSSAHALVHARCENLGCEPRMPQQSGNDMHPAPERLRQVQHVQPPWLRCQGRASESRGRSCRHTMSVHVLRKISSKARFIESAYITEQASSVEYGSCRSLQQHPIYQQVACALEKTVRDFAMRKRMTTLRLDVLLTPRLYALGARAAAFGACSGSLVQRASNTLTEALALDHKHSASNVVCN